MEVIYNNSINGYKYGIDTDHCYLTNDVLLIKKLHFVSEWEEFERYNKDKWDTDFITGTFVLRYNGKIRKLPAGYNMDNFLSYVICITDGAESFRELCKIYPFEELRKIYFEYLHDIIEDFHDGYCFRGIDIRTLSNGFNHECPRGNNNYRLARQKWDVNGVGLLDCSYGQEHIYFNVSEVNASKIERKYDAIVNDLGITKRFTDGDIPSFNYKVVFSCAHGGVAYYTNSPEKAAVLSFYFKMKEHYRNSPLPDMDISLSKCKLADDTVKFMDGLIKDIHAETDKLEFVQGKSCNKYFTVEELKDPVRNEGFTNDGQWVGIHFDDFYHVKEDRTVELSYHPSRYERWFNRMSALIHKKEKEQGNINEQNNIL